MKFSSLSALLVLFLFQLELLAVKGSRPGDKTTDEEQHLFPGTGFFIKDRSPYDDTEAKKMFLDADELHLKGEISSALKLYEKFSKRRSDFILTKDGSSVLVGPEALYRASLIRENKGDWKDAFDHLELVAIAYPRYDFERVAESLLRIAEKLAIEDLPRKWGVVPRFRSGSEDRARLSRIAELARGPRFAPRSLMVLAEIALKEDKEDDAIDALERIVNLYPEHYMCEKAYFLLASIYEGRVSGPSYDQGSTLKALNFFEDYLILFDRSPPQGKYEADSAYQHRLKLAVDRKKHAQKSKRDMRQILAESKVEIGKYVENYGKYFILRWKELGNKPALQFYNEAITTAPESEAARVAEERVAALRSGDD